MKSSCKITRYTSQSKFLMLFTYSLLFYLPVLPKVLVAVNGTTEFSIFLAPVSFERAKEICEETNGTLARISNNAEFTFVHDSLIVPALANLSEDYLWIVMFHKLSSFCLTSYLVRSS